MKRALTLLLSLSPVCSLYLAAQAAPQQQLTRALQLIEQGRTEPALVVLTTAAESSQASNLERGKAHALRGYAYREEGRLTESEKAFDEAFRFLRPTGDTSDDYAAALGYYSGLLIAKGDLKSAARSLKEAGEIYARAEKHAELARIYTRMAGVEITQKKYKEGRATLADARHESAAAGFSGNTTPPDVDATSGWLDTLTGKVREAVADYQAALEDCRKQYGDEHMLTGWSYLLLGKAQQSENDFDAAARSMNSGLEILKSTVGTNNVRYAVGELAYSDLLHHLGSHAEATRISIAATQSLKSMQKTDCVDCTVSVWSLRHEAER